jgi:ABC-2 type transport system ATP-binding protein
MIEIASLQKKYDGKTVLEIDNLRITKGELLGLTGNNGAGKTTFLRLLLDLIKPDRGTVKIGNIEITKSEQWKDYTGSFLDQSFLIDFLRPEEYFFFIGDLYGYSHSQINYKLNAFKSFFDNEILEQKNKLIRDFSEGNKQKIGIISSLIIDPELLILDEPFSLLDPSSQIFLKDLLVRLNNELRTTIIISSHNLNFIEEVSSRIVLLDKGRIILDVINTTDVSSQIEDYFYKLT